MPCAVLCFGFCILLPAKIYIKTVTLYTMRCHGVAGINYTFCKSTSNKICILFAMLCAIVWDLRHTCDFFCFSHNKKKNVSEHCFLYVTQHKSISIAFHILTTFTSKKKCSYVSHTKSGTFLHQSGPFSSIDIFFFKF